MNLETLKTEIERRIAEQFPKALFDAAVKQHTRRGHMTACVCEYCKTKRLLSRTFTRIPIEMRCLDEDYEFARLNQMAKREEVRRKLNSVLESELGM